MVFHENSVLKFDFNRAIIYKSSADDGIELPGCSAVW